MGHINDRYDRDKRAILGDGTYAIVYSGTCKKTGERVALKKLRHATAPAAAANRGGGTGPAAQLSLGGPLFSFHAGEAGAAAAAAAAGGAQAGAGAPAVEAALTVGAGGADDRGGVGQAALREIKVLQELRHPYIVRLRETVPHKDTLVLVFDYAAGGDLARLLYPGGDGNGCGSSKGSGEPCEPPLAADVIKAHMLALLEALAYCHEQGVLHRDVKPNNLLLDEQGRLLLADFGLARFLPREAAEEEAGEERERQHGAAEGQQQQQSERGDSGHSTGLPSNGAGTWDPIGCSGDGVAAVVTAGDVATNRSAAGVVANGGTGAGGSSSGGADRFGWREEADRADARPLMTHQIGMRWYRPPELLFGCRTYGTGVDIWAAGCVFAEMLLRRVWFKGTSDVDQLRLIFEVLGSPTEETWPGVKRLPNYLSFTPTPPQDLATAFPDADPDALDLLAQMTRLCPQQRPTARQALSHPYFTSGPPPAAPGQLPRTALPSSRAGAAPPGGFGAAAGRTGRGGGGGTNGRGDVATRWQLGMARVPIMDIPTMSSSGSLFAQARGQADVPFPRLPALPPVAPGRLPPGRLSFDGTGGFALAGGGGLAPLAGTQPLAPHTHHHHYVKKQHSFHLPPGPLAGLLAPLAASSAGGARTALAAAAADGGGGELGRRPGLDNGSMPPSCSAPSLALRFPVRLGALDPADGDILRGLAAATAAAESQPNPLQRPPGELQWPQGVPPWEAATVAPAASAPRRYRRGRRTRSSAGADMSVSATALVSGRGLSFEEGVTHEAEEVAEGDCEEGGEQDDGEEEVEGEVEGYEEDEGRPCVVRRFSFGSSLVTDGGDAATAPGGGPQATGRSGGNRSHRDGADGEAGVVAMATTATTAVGDPMSISVSICGGAGMSTVGSKRPRFALDAAWHHQHHHHNNYHAAQQPPHGMVAPATMANTARQGGGQSYSHHMHQAAGVGGVDVHMRGGSAGSGASGGIPGPPVAAAPSVSMVSAAPSMSFTAAVGGGGSEGDTEKPNRRQPAPSRESGGALMPPTTAASTAPGAAAAAAARRPPGGRPSDVTAAMSLSLAGGLDAAAQADYSHAPPPTVTGPRAHGAMSVDLPSVHRPVACDAEGGMNPGALPSFPRLPPAAPRMPAASADVAGFGGDVLGAMAAAVAVAALTGSVHLRGLRPILPSPDLQYLRQRKVEVDEALRQASDADGLQAHAQQQHEYQLPDVNAEGY